jgi:hypothetical protein
MSVIRQLSLFGVEATAPSANDLAGLLIAGGEITIDGDAAQVSIEVNHPWRASAIVAECARRGIAATSVSTDRSSVGVRTAYAPSLLVLAGSWVDGAVPRAPRTVLLDARVLRLWVMAAGHREPNAYALTVVEPEPGFRDAVGAGLARLGLAAQMVTRRGGAGDAVFRIVGRRRLARLVEMVGDAPKQAPADIWPS